MYNFALRHWFHLPNFLNASDKPLRPFPPIPACQKMSLSSNHTLQHGMGKHVSMLCSSLMVPKVAVL